MRRYIASVLQSMVGRDSSLPFTLNCLGDYSEARTISIFVRGHTIFTVLIEVNVRSFADVWLFPSIF